MEQNPSYDEHKEIIDAIKNRSANSCEIALENHFNTTLAGLKLEELEKEPPDVLLL